MDNLIFGDCLEVMSSIADHSIDMILCDLPYGMTACKWDSVISFEPLWEQYKRIIKPNGAIVLTASQPFTSALIMSNPKWYRHQWVWNKNSSGAFAIAKIRPLSVCEDILVFGKNKVNYYPIMEVRGKPRNKSGYSISNNYGIKPLKSKVKSNTYYPKNLLTFSNASQKGKFHPTQKPVALFEYLIKIYTNEGDLVLDNCIGSGTTAIAAINTNRNWIGIEKDQTYYEKALARITSHLELLNSERSA